MMKKNKIKFNPTIGIITALSIEYLAMKTILDNSYEKTIPKIGKCLLGVIKSKEIGNHYLILAEAGMGNNRSSICAEKIQQHFPSIDTVIMVGIAGATPCPEKPEAHVRLGDIVVSGSHGIVQYDFVKKTTKGPVYRHPPRPPKSSLLNAANTLKREEEEGKFPWNEHISVGINKRGKEWQRPSQQTDKLFDYYTSKIIKHPNDKNRRKGEPKIFIGTIASGNTLLKDPMTRDKLRDDLSAKAVEMEASGIADSSWINEISYFAIRGTCDYCDENKNDTWQKYASIISAGYTKALLESIPGKNKKNNIISKIRSSSLTDEFECKKNQPKANKYFQLPYNLPSIQNWVGRKQELETLQNKILDKETRAIEIAGSAIGVIGPAGVGKTILASQLIRLLYQNKTPFATAAWECLRPDLGTKKPPNFHGIIDSLLFKLSYGKITSKLTSKDDYRIKTARLITLLNEQACLIVLDNVETVLKTGQAERAGYFEKNCPEYAWLFKELVETEHQSKIIFTSRESLSELSRRMYHPFSLSGLDSQSSISLLKQYNLIATDKDLKKLADRYKGHPKALEIVSALLLDDKRFHGNVEKFLLDRKWLLTVDIEKLVDEMIQRLSNKEKECLLRISVYQTDDYPLSLSGIATQLTGLNEYEIEENIIKALERRQLLDFDTEKNTYQLHPIVQETAYHILLKDKLLLHSAHQRAYEYFVNIKLQPETQWHGVEDIMPRIKAHYHACILENFDKALDVVMPIKTFLDQWGKYRLLIELLICLIPNNWKDGGQKLNSTSSHGEILRSIGAGYFWLGNFNLALEFANAGLLNAQQTKENKLERRILNNIGMIYMSLGENQKAIAYIHKALEIKKDIDTVEESKSFVNLGITSYNLGKYKEAISYYEQSLAILKKTKERHGKLRILNNLGNAHLALGNYRKAISYYKRSLDISEHDKRGKAGAVLNSGYAHYFLGDYRKAISFFEHSLLIRKEIGDKSGESISLTSLGNAYAALGEYRKSIDYFQLALNIVEKSNYKILKGNILNNLGYSCNNIGNQKQAVKYCNESLTISRSLSDKKEEGFALNNMGAIYYKLGDYKTSERYYSQAFIIAQEIEFKQLEASVLKGLGVTLCKVKNQSQALQKLKQAKIISLQLGDKRIQAETYKALADLHHELKQTQLAVQYCQEALSIAQKLKIPLVEKCQDLLKELHEINQPQS